MPRRTNNGLELDFSLETAEERQKYVSELVSLWEKEGKKLRNEDLELLGDYVLYGKEGDGESLVDKGFVEIKTRYGTFARKAPSSLNALIEDPNFNEETISPLNRKKIYRTPKPTINRSENSQIEPLRELWESIDRLANEIDYFSRKKDISKFPEEEQTRLLRRKPPTRYELYQMRHNLVEMRREQFTIRDSFIPTITPLVPRFRFIDTDITPDSINWEDSNYTILPLGLYSDKNPVFTDYLEKESYPGHLAEHKAFFDRRDLEERKKEDWKEEGCCARTDKIAIDFSNPNHIYNLFKFYRELETSSENDPESLVAAILSTLNFYSAAASLTSEQREILHQKIYKQSNVHIVEILKEKFGKTHTDNYISTIFKKNICNAIAEAARLHYDTYKNREKPMAFKNCNCCGKAKLKDTRNFVRKARSSDGFSNCCKRCDKENRIKN